jgi:hypothetical protein
MLRRCSPAAGRPPPLALRLGRRLNYSCMHLFSFASSQASRRCIPRAKPWPETLFSAVAGDPPPPSHVRAWPAAGSAVDGSDQPGPWVNPAGNGQPGVFLLNRPPVS